MKTLCNAIALTMMIVVITLVSCSLLEKKPQETLVELSPAAIKAKQNVSTDIDIKTTTKKK